ncbi:B-cell receptor-associated protein [Melia azedarach]|uniref:B-cell receptor-associated protein n=1 Tax=Melia azedarach TaxID=155640 RepID=A0ACC1XH19_MELAZ|nr:B-cell receptor-associated protein [Melia azedarach]
MALEWVVLGYAAAAEAIMVLLLTLPGLDGLRKGLVAVTRNLLKPFLSVVPFCLFLLMDIYWKYETRPPLRWRLMYSDRAFASPEVNHEESAQRAVDRFGFGVLLVALLGDAPCCEDRAVESED